MQKILLVDDSPAMRNMIRRVIVLTGIEDAEFIEAGNGLEALAAIRTHPVDAVLCDINMPVMDGETFLAELAATPGTAKPPVLVVSTDSTHTRVARMIGLGAAGYLRKPFTPEAMRDALESLMASAGRCGV